LEPALLENVNMCNPNQGNRVGRCGLDSCGSG